MVKKVINAEIKSALRPRSTTKKIHQNCPQSNQLANSTVAKSQNSAMKELRSEKPKVWGTKSSSGPQHFKSSKKTRKKKKKKKYQRD